MQIEVAFAHQNHKGRVFVTTERTLSPVILGVGDSALGLANCTATIEFSARGYRGLLGWVQLVRSTDNAFQGRQFEMDPFDPFGLYKRAPLPYCWYGIAPTLFDAPSRDERVHLDWVAHSFLAASPFGGNTKIVMPLLGFSWALTSLTKETSRFSPLRRSPPLIGRRTCHTCVTAIKDGNSRRWRSP